MPKNHSTGAAIITVLLILTILLVLGLSFLTFLKNDYYFLRKISYSIGAFYLAQAGLKYYQACGLPQVSEIPLGTTQRVFSIIQINSETIQCTGKIKNSSGKIITKYTIIYKPLENKWHQK